MTMGMLKKMAFMEMGKKAVELYKAGNSIEQIKEKFYNQPQVAQGLVILGVDDTELTEMIEKEIKKKGGK